MAVLPAGAIEQHGPHLPIGVDAFLAEQVAVAAAERLEPAGSALVCPVLAYGYSAAHAGFCGTMSLTAETFLAAVAELGGCLGGHGFRRLLVLNGHGGNFDVLKLAVRQLRDRYPDLTVAAASYWQLASATIGDWRESGPGGISHACELETSLMLHLAPQLVRTEAIEDFVPAWSSEYVVDDLQYGGRVFPGVRVEDFSPSGTLGRPTLATAERGAALFPRIVDDVAAFLAEFRGWDRARMTDDETPLPTGEGD